MAAGPGFILALGSAIVCYFAAGDRLGLLFGGVLTATLIVPFLVLAERRRADRAIVAGAVIVAIGIVWLAPALAGRISWGAWLACVGVLAAHVLALGTVASLLRRLGLSGASAGGAVVLLALAWLTWPFWLSPWMTWSNRQEVVAALVAGHPLFAINGAIGGQFWPNHLLSYHLMNVMNDIPYELPRSVWRMVIVHGGIAAVFGLAAGGAIARREDEGRRRDGEVGTTDERG